MAEVKLEGRFYEAAFPQLEEVVVVQVKRIVDMGAYVTLLEYDNKEGMMLLSELSKRRIRSVAKLLKVGRTEICMVLRVDEDKGYIDLSKRRVAAEDAAAKEDSYAKAKAVHGIMRHCASNLDIPVEELCRKIAWPLYEKYDNAYEVFKKHAITEEINMWDEIGWDSVDCWADDVKDAIKKDIEESLRRKLIQQMCRLRAKCEVSCSEYEGIDAIREALLKGFEASTEESEVKIRLIAHPLFILNCTCRDKSSGIETLEKAMELIKESIEAAGGVYRMALAPELVGDKEDEKDDDKDGSGEDDDGDNESSESEQDDTMGQLNDADLEALKAKELDDDGDED